MKVLLVEPDFPIPKKSKNHAKFLPLPLLKFANYHKLNGDMVELVRGNRKIDFYPDVIKITSLFTYWHKYVFDSIRFYKYLYPKAKIQVGGIYASLMPEHIQKNFSDIDVHQGICPAIDEVKADYSWVDVDYQILQASRGCFRRCPFCGVYKIEPKITFKEWDILKEEIIKNKVVFYDNNILMNPNIENILDELSQFRVNGKIICCEAQSGFDARLITLKIARLIKKARFTAVRIAWDWGLDEKILIKQALKNLYKAGFWYKNMSVFMIYNWDIPFTVLEGKRETCREWNVQITDCRFRPLDQLYDEYNPRKNQTNSDYHIHYNWIDKQVKTFRHRVREQNICVRFGFQDLQHYYEWVRNKKKTKPLVNNGLFNWLKR